MLKTLGIMAGLIILVAIVLPMTFQYLSGGKDWNYNETILALTTALLAIVTMMILMRDVTHFLLNKEQDTMVIYAT